MVLPRNIFFGKCYICGSNPRLKERFAQAHMEEKNDMDLCVIVFEVNFVESNRVSGGWILVPDEGIVFL